MALSEKIRKGIETKPAAPEGPRIVDHKLPERPLPRPNPYTDWLAIGPAEEAVLWASYVNPAYRREAMLVITAGDFSAVWRQQVWQAVMGLHRERRPVDLQGIMGRVEGHSFLAFLDMCSRVQNPYGRDWLGLMVQAAELRRAALGALSNKALLE